jgi:cell division protein FtsQ
LPGRRGARDLRRLLPSGRSILLGIALFGVAAGGYVGARETSVFAVRQVEVTGGTPRVRASVAAALRPELGRSLLKIDAASLVRRLAAVPEVRSATLDRAFPHTLRVVVTPERPVLLLRRGAQGWVVSARGRVLRPVRNTRLSSLPRAWMPRETRVVVGEVLAPTGAAAAAAVAPLAGVSYPAQVRFVRSGKKELTLVLRSSTEVRLGDLGDLRLKLAIARRILLAVGAEIAGGYVDVSVPERAVVAPANPQVEG